MQEETKSDSPFCSQCGGVLAPDAQFCSHCGKPTANSKLLPGTQQVTSLPSHNHTSKPKSKLNFILFGSVAAYALLIFVPIIFVPIFNAANQAKEKESALVESDQIKREADKKIQESFDKIDNILQNLDTPKLELQSRNWSFEAGSFAEVVGKVKNISDTSLDNVTVVATFYDKSGNVVTTEETLIGYQPILPGQISPFKVITTYNPAMAKASLNFKELTGGTIEFEDKSKK